MKTFWHSEKHSFVKNMIQTFSVTLISTKFVKLNFELFILLLYIYTNRQHLCKIYSKALLVSFVLILNMESHNGIKSFENFFNLGFSV